MTNQKTLIGQKADVFEVGNPGKIEADGYFHPM
jgi:hypothetical protein